MDLVWENSGKSQISNASLYCQTWLCETIIYWVLSQSDGKIVFFEVFYQYWSRFEWQSRWWFELRLKFSENRWNSRRDWHGKSHRDFHRIATSWRLFFRIAAFFAWRLNRNQHRNPHSDLNRDVAILSLLDYRLHLNFLQTATRSVLFLHRLQFSLVLRNAAWYFIRKSRFWSEFLFWAF